MSPKELLYIEDTLDHMCANKKCCTDFSSQTQDPALRTLLQDITAKQAETFNKFYSLLNG
jgi:hypothetical protein